MTVELIIAVLVGAVLLLALNNIVTSHIYLSQRGRDLVVANAYAEQKIEALRSQGYLTLSDGAIDVTSELPSELKAPRNAVLTVSAQSTAVKKIHLSITYNEQGAPRTQIYTTYIGELGVGQ